MTGGMWCANASTFAFLTRQMDQVSTRDEFFQDTNWLNARVWPEAVKDVLQHDSFSCAKYTGSVPFPTRRVGWEHVGSVYVNGQMRESDVDVLRRARAPVQCTPPETAAVATGLHMPTGNTSVVLFPPDFSNSQSGNGASAYIFDSLMHKKHQIGTFVEFGCHDGRTNSNTFAFEKMGWSGLCIEPNYPNYLKAKQVRQHTVFALITGEAREYTYAQGSKECDQMSGIIEFYSPEYMSILRQCENDGLVRRIPLVGALLETLLHQHGFTKVDWISVDCEGCEASFITQFNFSRWGVQIVSYEPNTAARMRTSEIEAALTGHGFVFDRQQQDRIWRRPGALNLTPF
jgi:hypothetical protein